MQSCRAPMRWLLPALPVLLGLTGCAVGPRTVTIPVALTCGARIPPQLRDDVAHAPLPPGNTVGDWVTFADDQTGRLERANDRKATVLWIIDHCESETRSASKRLETRGPWWRRLPWSSDHE
jgi:hypothetical protein